MRKGTHHTPESRAKTSEALRKDWQRPERKAKVVGRPRSPETRAKISASRKAAWARQKAAEAENGQAD